MPATCTGEFDRAKYARGESLSLVLVGKSFGCLYLCALRSASFSCAVCREDEEKGAFFATLQQVTSFIVVSFQLLKNASGFLCLLLSKYIFEGERACELEARDVW